MSILRSWWLVPFALVTIVALGGIGCNKPKDEKSTAEAKTDATAKPKVVKLEIKDTVTGKGPGAAKGDLLALKYSGKLANGKEFDSNLNTMPMHMYLGNGEVIKGWDDGLVGIKEGGKRSLSIPFDLAYGDRSTGPIPPKSDLFFEVECLGIIKAADLETVTITDLKKGSGPEVKEGNTVTVKFVGTILNGKKFDASSEYGGTYTFKVGAPTVISGFNAAVVGMRPGGKRKARIPPRIGRNEMVSVMLPDKSIVEFEIDLLSVK
ncbi:MAG: FKBP-type peptidyl-prolyl cis-trans isomerase [Fimbriimonas sp.]